MKKYFKFLMLLPFMGLLASCNLGDSEPVGKYAFETDDNMILIEAKLPAGTYDADEIYIAGAFNGAEAESYVEDAKWRLTQSSVNINIFGVYLDPTTFAEGTSLADGFWLYSKNSGLSLTTKKEMATFTSNSDKGQRTSIVVSVWGEPVKEEVETLPEHDGYRVYVENRAGWEGMALYAWGDEEFFGGWPGAQPTGTETISGVEYTYFEFDAAGLNLNLIINNNNGGSQTDNINITFGDQKDFFYAVTGTGNPCTHEVIENPIKKQEKLPEHEGFRVYVDNYAGWEGMALYAWGDEEFFGGWPGAQPTGTETIGGVEYTYFEFDATGLNLNLIINNNNGGSQTDNINITFGEEQIDFFYVVTGTGNPCTHEVIEDPFNRQPIGGGEETPEPEDPETPAEPVYVYVNDQTGWTTFAHYWNESGFTTKWPGVSFAEAESVKLSGVEYTYFQVDPEAGAAITAIFSNDGSETERLQKGLTTDKTRYYTLTATELTETQPKARIYVEDKTEWETINLYCWGDAEVFGKWPGAQVAGTEKIGDVDYKYFEVPSESLGLKVNLIFNNGDGKVENKDAQKDLALSQDYFYVVTADDAVFAE